jgi:hypothetical protein
VDNKRAKNILDYATPDPPMSVSRVFAGLLCAPAAMVGVLATLRGVIGLGKYLLFGESHADSATTLVIGAASLFLAVQWARHALGRKARKG